MWRRGTGLLADRWLRRRSEVHLMGTALLTNQLQQKRARALFLSSRASCAFIFLDWFTHSSYTLRWATRTPEPAQPSPCSLASREPMQSTDCTHLLIILCLQFPEYHTGSEWFWLFFFKTKSCWIIFKYLLTYRGEILKIQTLPPTAGRQPPPKYIICTYIYNLINLLYANDDMYILHLFIFMEYLTSRLPPVSWIYFIFLFKTFVYFALWNKRMLLIEFYVGFLISEYIFTGSKSDFFVYIYLFILAGAKN